MNFIVEYWLQAAFAVILAAMGAVMKQLSTRIRQEQKESDAIKTAMVAMLHDRLFQCCKHHIKNGYIPLDESEAVLDNLKLLYDTYTALGGNGTGTEMYKRTKALPIKKEDLRNVQHT